MARVKRGTTSHAKHKKVLKAVKGQWGRRKNTIRVPRSMGVRLLSRSRTPEWGITFRQSSSRGLWSRWLLFVMSRGRRLLDHEWCSAIPTSAHMDSSFPSTHRFHPDRRPSIESRSTSRTELSMWNCTTSFIFRSRTTTPISRTCWKSVGSPSMVSRPRMIPSSLPRR